MTQDEAKLKAAQRALTAIEKSEAPAEYTLVITGFPPLNERHIAGGLDRALAANTSLVVKGREPLRPLDVDLAPRGRTLDITFRFPATVSLSAEDHEVEFSTSAGPLHIRHRFRLKDMVYQGKLTL